MPGTSVADAAPCIKVAIKSYILLTAQLSIHLETMVDHSK
jgi:hypothetical protein